jgi:RNA polymerase sigma-70 factor (ECF subfamily)
MSDVRTTRSTSVAAAPPRPKAPAAARVPAEERRERLDHRAAAPLSHDTQVAIEIRALVGIGTPGSLAEARERFSELVALHQRRALRIAYQYLRDPGEADEAVQDAFVKVFGHIESYREAWPFEVWFTRILINGCLDRRKTRQRRDRWFTQSAGNAGHDDARNPAGYDDARPAFGTPPGSDPESLLLARERRAHLAAAIDRLDGRQRTVFMLTHFGDCTPREVSAMTGLNESTVRVHLFRAARKLRGLLGGKP